MQNIEANWEDEDHNRQVAFSVEYARRDDAIEIRAMTPKHVTFLCPESNQPLRTIRVWTDKGRELLTSQLQSSGSQTRLEQQVHASLAV